MIDDINYDLKDYPVVERGEPKDGINFYDKYPPIKSDAKWLINKTTGEVFPNMSPFNEMLADILEPYEGELKVPAEVSKTKPKTNKIVDLTEDL